MKLGLKITLKGIDKMKNNEEQRIQKDIMDYIRSLGYLPFKQNQIGVYGEKGVPDIICCIKGLFVAFEVKVPGKKPTKIQQVYLDKINYIDGIAYCVHNVEEVKNILDKKL